MHNASDQREGRVKVDGAMIVSNRVGVAFYRWLRMAGAKSVLILDCAIGGACLFAIACKQGNAPHKMAN